MAGTGEARTPVFVGGSSRSGTHPVSNLLGKSKSLHLIPREVSFHAVPSGLVGYIRGRFDRDDLIERVRRRWWRVGGKAGFEGVVTREQLNEALAEFAVAPDDRVAASRDLVKSLLDPVARAAGKPSWIEKSVQNVVGAPALVSMFPDAGIVHMVRDGRDVACSIARMPWGPDTVPEAVGYWADRLRRAEVGAADLPPGRMLVIHLEDLVLLDREASYARLLDYLQMDNEPDMQSFFDTELTPERAHLGRWRIELDEVEREQVDVAYREALRQLRAEGVGSTPPDRTLDVRYSATASPENPLDPWTRQNA